MKQKHGDIVIVEGNNELNVQMAPIVPVAVYRCVYCPAAFSTEAGLVSHMESSHPGKPYVVYAYPEGAAPSGGSIGINYKVYTPAVPAGERTYGFTFYIPGYPIWEPYNGAYVDLRGGTPEGFYTGTETWRAAYNAGGWPPTFKDIPRGTYPLYSRCRHLADVGEYAWAVIKTFWKDIDTGQTITVV